MLKDVMVFLEGAPLDESGIRQAEVIAAHFGAHLTGLFAAILPDLMVAVPIEGGAAALEVFIEIENRAKADADQKHAKLRERFERLGVTRELRRIDATPGMIAARIAREARWGDLLIVPRPSIASDSNLWRDIAEKALFESGRSVLILPDGPGANAVPSSIMIAWKDTRECAHAIAEAAPFIAQSSRVVVTSVDPKLQAQGKPVTPEADIAAHLGRLGARGVEVREVAGGGRDVHDALLTEARRMSADMIVMGGYGHSRLREWVLGGATHDMLETCEFPMLLAH